MILRGKTREEHEQEEQAALSCAAGALKVSNPLLKSVSQQKLQIMAHETLCAYIKESARQSAGLDLDAQQVNDLIEQVPGRVPRLEPFIRQALSIVKDHDHPFEKPVFEWDAQEMVVFISSVCAFAMLGENLAADGVKM